MACADRLRLFVVDLGRLAVRRLANSRVTAVASSLRIWLMLPPTCFSARLELLPARDRLEARQQEAIAHGADHGMVRSR